MSRKPGEGSPGTPLRDWSMASYSAKDGRAAKSSEPAARSYSAGGVVEGWSVSSQVNEARNPGQNGAPGAASMSKNNSGDPGRVKFSRDNSHPRESKVWK
jgi:hypothetical protein